jgi:hypothetical protein
MFPLMFWTGSGACGILESEKRQGSMTLIRKVLISLILQQRTLLVYQLITLREAPICAIPGLLINVNMKLFA